MSKQIQKQIQKPVRRTEPETPTNPVTGKPMPF